MAVARASRPNEALDIPLEEAVRVALAREGHKEVPSGYWEEGLWLPNPEERRPCCEKIQPTPGNRQALENHCRTRAHVANLFDVPVAALKRAVLAARRQAKGASADETPEPLSPGGSRDLEQLITTSRSALRDAKMELEREVVRLGPLLRGELDEEATTLRELLGVTGDLERHLEVFHALAKLHEEAQKARTVCERQRQRLSA